MRQAEALSILKTGANVFLTGEPGAGKTHTVNSYVAYLRSRGVEPAITASTGIAATHIGGMTIHSWSGIGIRRRLDKYDLDRIASNERLAKRIGRASVLVIDEVSMLSPATLSMVETVCREVRQSTEAFGSLQVILVGDFFQLPPVVRAEENMQESLMSERTPRFAYEAPLWERARFVTCYLTEQHRQDDADFLHVLSAIRRNEYTAAHHEHVAKRQVKGKDAPSDITRLFSHNADVDRLNGEALGNLSGEEQSFEMFSHGVPHLVESLKKGCLSPETLRLRVGAKVMFTKNNPSMGFVNGTLGEVVELERGSAPVIRTRQGRLIEVEPAEWVVEEGNRVLARISQLPLRLAWAITVHKSQGMSLDAAVMDLSDVFEFGQGYVALSRVRRLAGLYLLGFNARTFQVHPEVLERDASFRADSEAAREAFGKLSPEELGKMHENFIKSVGGKAGKSSRPSSFANMREEHPNAYRRWGSEEEEKLKSLFAKGESIGSLAETLGRKPGGIRSRLVKLGLLEE